MPLLELWRESVRALQAHRLRSFLTLLGVIIGVTTLVAVVSVISGLNSFVQEKVITTPDGPAIYMVQTRQAFEGRRGVA